MKTTTSTVTPQKMSGEGLATAQLALLGQRGLYRFIVLLLALNVLLPLGALIGAVLEGEDYWTPFEREWSVLTWFSTLQLLAIALLAYLNFQLSRIRHRTGIGIVGRYVWVWLVFAAGFAFLALDERFDLHQQLRDQVFVPANIASDSQLVRPGDIGLYLYFLIGLAFTGFLVTELRRYRAALVLFVTALPVVASTIVVDSLPLDVTMAWPGGRLWTSVYEETGELWGQLFFALSFSLFLVHQLAQVKYLCKDDSVTGQSPGMAY